MFIAPTKKDYCRRCRLVILNEKTVGSYVKVNVSDAIRIYVDNKTTLVYIGRTNENYAESDLIFRTASGGGLPIYLSHCRFSEEQIGIVWEEDWNKKTVTSSDNSIYCSCGGPAKICDTGYSKYTVCSKCKKEKQVIIV